MNYIEPLKNVITRKCLIKAMTSRHICKKLDYMMLYNILKINPIAEYIEQLVKIKMKMPK